MDGPDMQRNQMKALKRMLNGEYNDDYLIYVPHQNFSLAIFVLRRGFLINIGCSER